VDTLPAAHQYQYTINNNEESVYKTGFKLGEVVSTTQHYKAKQHKQQTTNNKQTTNSKQQTTNNKQQTTNNKQLHDWSNIKTINYKTINNKAI